MALVGHGRQPAARAGEDGPCTARRVLAAFRGYHGLEHRARCNTYRR
jgi:hypothetical protein